LFDNSKVKRVAGDFSCEKDLARVLAEPIARVQARLSAEGTNVYEFEPLLDRIAREQRKLGAVAG
jgi:hypothetical protein